MTNRNLGDAMSPAQEAALWDEMLACGYPFDREYFDLAATDAGYVRGGQCTCSAPRGVHFARCGWFVDCGEAKEC